jgi:hypothetical protein
MKIDLKCFTRTYVKPNKTKGLLQISCKLDSNNLILSSRQNPLKGLFIFQIFQMMFQCLDRNLDFPDQEP